MVFGCPTAPPEPPQLRTNPVTRRYRRQDKGDTGSIFMLKAFVGLLQLGASVGGGFRG